MQRMKLPVIRFRKSPAQALEKQSFSQFGQFHRLRQTLRRRQPPQHIHVPAAIWLGLTFHVNQCTPSRGK
jgi:hypothetical protein